jgi:glycine betaine/choline ABC-type transport system substrate-binding protein
VAAVRVVWCVVAVLVTACGDDARVTVGAKNFTEQRILGEIVAQAVEAAGMPVRRRFDLGGTFVCDAALRAGDVDVYVEYTGTALTAVLKQGPEADARRVYERVAAAYRAAGLEWMPPLGFDNTFAMVVRGAEEVGTLSAAVPLARGWTAGFGYEFRTRPDGYPALERVYGLTFGSVKTMDLGLLYRALVERQVDVVAGNATDGLIESLGLRVLADDRRAFPPYEAAAVVRADALAQHRGLREALAALGGTIGAADMRRMNHAVDGERRNPAAVVREWRAGRGAPVHEIERARAQR